MRESFHPYNGNYEVEQNNYTSYTVAGGVAPFFSMRKLRLVYNELVGDSSFEYKNFEAFKHQVLSSVAPQVELNKWQGIAARR